MTLNEIYDNIYYIAYSIKLYYKQKKVNVLNNINLLFENSSKNNIQDITFEFNNNICRIGFKFLIIDFSILDELICVLKNINNNIIYYKKPIVFDINKIYFLDKLTIMLFECICLYLKENEYRDVQIVGNPNFSIFTEGISSSPILLLQSDAYIKREEYPHKFRFDIYKKHYRREILYDKYKDDSQYLSKILCEIKIFLNNICNNKMVNMDLSEVVVEIVGNALEHTQTNCLLDIDVSSNYVKKNDDGEYYGMNIAIMNISSILFWDKLKNKIINMCQGCDIPDRYNDVKKAYNSHSLKFTKKYDIDDFFIIASFQHKISGRSNSTTGGTGLTKLISSLEKNSDTHNCYLVSGHKQLIFKHEYLEYNKENWIGFNNSKDFINDIPNKKVIQRIDMNISGTGFNLNFVIKK